MTRSTHLRSGSRVFVDALAGLTPLSWIGCDGQSDRSNCSVCASAAFDRRGWSGQAVEHRYERNADTRCSRDLMRADDDRDAHRPSRPSGHGCLPSSTKANYGSRGNTRSSLDNEAFIIASTNCSFLPAGLTRVGLKTRRSALKRRSPSDRGRRDGRYNRRCQSTSRIDRL